MIKLIRRKVVEIIVNGMERMDIVIDEVKERNKKGREEEIRVGGRIREEELEKIRFRRGEEWNEEGRRKVEWGIGKKKRRLIERKKKIVGVGGRVGEGIKRFWVIDEEENEVEEVLRKKRILIEWEGRIEVFKDREVKMNEGEIVEKERIRNEGWSFEIGIGKMMKEIFMNMNIVGVEKKSVEFSEKLVMRGRELMVVILKSKKNLREKGKNLGKNVMKDVDWRKGEIEEIEERKMEEIEGLIIGVVVGWKLGDIEIEESIERIGIEIKIVEEEELGLREEIESIENEERFKIGLGIIGSSKRIKDVDLEGKRIKDIEENEKSGMGEERVDMRSLRIGNKKNVGLVDGIKEWDRREVENEKVEENVLVKEEDINSKVMEIEIRIGEEKVEEIEVVIFDMFKNIVGSSNFKLMLERRWLVEG